jgi:hypothetical protein
MKDVRKKGGALRLPEGLAGRQNFKPFESRLESRQKISFSPNSMMRLPPLNCLSSRKRGAVTLA